MLTAEQLEIRRRGLTATDMVVLAAGTDWHGRTAHDLFASKVYGVESFEETEAMSIGTELEPMVLRRAGEKLCLHLRKGKTIQSTKHPLRIATPDAFGVRARGDGEVLVQAKVVGLQASKAWGETEGGVEEIPEAVFVQCAWELDVTDRQVNHVAALVGTEVRTYTIDRARDGVDELVGQLAELGERFWRDHVVARRPPAVDGSAAAARMLAAIWPRETRPLVRASADAEKIAARYFAANASIKVLEEEKKLAAQQLRVFVEDCEGVKGDGWRALVKWRNPVEIPASVRSGYRAFDCRAVKT